jgi:hypothetical protein
VTKLKLNPARHRAYQLITGQMMRSTIDDPSIVREVLENKLLFLAPFDNFAAIFEVFVGAMYCTS